MWRMNNKKQIIILNNKKNFTLLSSLMFEFIENSMEAYQTIQYTHITQRIGKNIIYDKMIR